ncbi:MAG: hypothetical protein HY836_07730 [Aquabacterium sp.]|uniref:hypothetical protein n=1 Tax=Aquabacterium sp. TaxID=1872578 RepID=UPI0025BE30B4|nr:hypothetical protein [Aquabacterium sp.]MBI5925477.1 hypothetical protein [Aquabacterium sp.]
MINLVSLKSRYIGSAITFFALAAGFGTVQAATDVAPIAQAASTGVATKVAPATGAIKRIEPVSAGGLTTKGDKEYPTGTLPIPPKPKKEGAAVQLSGQGGGNQYPTGTLPIPPKPKKEGLEAAGAIKAKAAQP